MGLFRRGDLPEALPKGWDQLGRHPDFTEKRLTPEEVDRYCRANNVSANDAYNAKRFLACVIPGKREVVLPVKGSLRDPAREQAIETHEYGHTWGLAHKGGKGWFTDGQPAQPLSSNAARMMQAMASGNTRLAGLIGAQYPKK